MIAIGARWIYNFSPSISSPGADESKGTLKQEKKKAKKQTISSQHIITGNRSSVRYGFPAKSAAKTSKPEQLQITFKFRCAGHPYPLHGIAI